MVLANLICYDLEEYSRIKALMKDEYRNIEVDRCGCDNLVLKRQKNIHTPMQKSVGSIQV
jgi:hypothetical protein